MPLKVLTREQTAARIKAARLLTGISQGELAQKLADQGLPWRLAGALERCGVDITHAAVRALAEATGIPEWWFTAPFDYLWEDAPVDQRYQEVLGRLERIERKLDG